MLSPQFYDLTSMDLQLLRKDNPLALLLAPEYSPQVKHKLCAQDEMQTKQKSNTERKIHLSMHKCRGRDFLPRIGCFIFIFGCDSRSAAAKSGCSSNNTRRSLRRCRSRNWQFVGNSRECLNFRNGVEARIGCFGGDVLCRMR